MIALDLIIVLFMAFLVAKGIWKGFVKEIAGIVAVVAGVLVAFTYHYSFSQVLEPYLGEKYLSIAAYVVLFLVTYIAAMLLGNLLDKILKTIMLGGINRLFGGLFGIIKAVLWLTLLTYGYTTLQEGVGFDHPDWITESMFYPFFIDASDIAKSYLGEASA